MHILGFLKVVFNDTPPTFNWFSIVILIFAGKKKLKYFLQHLSCKSLDCPLQWLWNGRWFTLVYCYKKQQMEIGALNHLVCTGSDRGGIASLENILSFRWGHKSQWISPGIGGTAQVRAQISELTLGILRMLSFKLLNLFVNTRCFFRSTRQTITVMHSYTQVFDEFVTRRNTCWKVGSLI